MREQMDKLGFGAGSKVAHNRDAIYMSYIL